MRHSPTLSFERPWQLPAIRLVLRLAMWSRPVSGVSVENRDVGDCRVRIYRPEHIKSDAALLWLHAGGFVMGSPGQDDERCSMYARDLGIVVVSAFYRLAPASPFPAALDDGVAIWRWLQASAGELRIDASRIAVAGESSGAGLAASLTQRLRDEGASRPAAQMLLHPMLDDRTAANTDLDADRHYVWNNHNNRAAWTFYLGHEPSAPEVAAYAAPGRCEDLAGLPPAWIGIAELDLFRDENCAYARRLQNAGVPCTTEYVDGAYHAFATVVPEASLSQAFLRSQHAFLQRQLAL